MSLKLDKQRVPSFCCWTRWFETCVMQTAEVTLLYWGQGLRWNNHKSTCFVWYSVEERSEVVDIDMISWRNVRI